MAMGILLLSGGEKINNGERGGSLGFKLLIKFYIIVLNTMHSNWSFDEDIDEQESFFEA